MAENKLTIKGLSGDFGMKSKDVVEGFKTLGIEKNSSANVSDEEFELFFQHMTMTHQIRDIDGYTSGKTTLRLAKSAPKKAEPKMAAKPVME